MIYLANPDTVNPPLTPSIEMFLGHVHLTHIYNPAEQQLGQPRSRSSGSSAESANIELRYSTATTSLHHESRKW